MHLTSYSEICQPNFCAVYYLWIHYLCLFCSRMHLFDFWTYQALYRMLSSTTKSSKIKNNLSILFIVFLYNQYFINYSVFNLSKRFVLNIKYVKT